MASSSFGGAACALCLAALALVACSSDGGSGDENVDPLTSGANAGVDVNDVSILFPLRKVGSGPQDFDLYPRIDLAPSFFDEALLKQLIDFGATRGTDNIFDGLKNWRVAALRYDPCFPDPSAPPEKCVPQIRLITQQIRDIPGPGIDDSGMHLLFRASDAFPAKGDAIVKELKAIQEASRKAGAETVGRTLGPHPGLVAEAAARKGPVGDLVRAFVTKHCTRDRLLEITFTGTGDGGEQWFFYGGPVTNGKWAPATVPNVASKPADGNDPGEDALSIGLLGVVEEQVISPEPMASATSIAPVLNRDPAKVPPSDLAKLHRIDNPLLSNPKNTDCASCHASSRLLRQRAVPFTGKGDEFENPIGVTGFAELALQPEDESSVRNFGWLFAKPVVTWLTANSSAAVAARVNASQSWQNPSRQDCRAPAVRECFAGRAAGGKKTKGTAAECLRACRPVTSGP